MISSFSINGSCIIGNTDLVSDKFISIGHDDPYNPLLAYHVITTNVAGAWSITKNGIPIISGSGRTDIILEDGIYEIVTN